MGICVNPYCELFCQVSEHNQGQSRCKICDSHLLIQHRYRLLKLLKPLLNSQQTKIFEAEDLKHNNRRVVIKLVDLPYLQQINLLRREFDFLIHRPKPFLQIGIDDFFEFLPHPDLPVQVHCLVLPKLKGMDSENYIQKKGPLSVELALKCFKQLAKFIELIHCEGYIHRDIKPSNIIISEQLSLTLIDFETVRKVDAQYLSLLGTNVTSPEGARVTNTRIMSSGYSAPEQSEGGAIPQSDFYAMARTFVFWVTGQNPREFFHAGSGRLIWHEGVKDLSPSLRKFMNDLMSTRINQRPTDIESIETFLDKQLPLLQRREQLTKSKPFQISAVLMILSLGIIGYQVIRWGGARYFFYRGSEQSFNQKFDEAKFNFERSLQFDPKFQDAYHNLASLCQAEGDFQCALKNHEKVIELNPNRWETYHNLATLYEDQLKYKEAEINYREAISLSRNKSILPLNNLARVYILRDRPSEAIPLAKKGIALTSSPEELAILHKNLGWAYLKQNRHEDALTHLEISRDLMMNNADSYCLLAQLYDRRSERLEAKNNWLTCFSLNSTAPEVVAWRAEVINRMMK